MSVAASPIRRVLLTGTVPPSVAQERLWFLDQLESSTAVYNVSWGLRLRGSLNVVALELSLREIVRRHEVLRTRFSMVNGSLEGVVHDPTEFSLSATDLRKVPDQDREAEARRLAKVEADQPLELSRGLQLRVRRIQLADDEHWLILTMHQVTPDEISMEILHRELAALYEAFADGRSSPLPELPVQYVDYGAWQRAWLQDEALNEQLSFWKRQLSGAPARLELPTDYPRPALPSYQGAVEEILLDETLSRALRDLSRREGVTLFITLMAAFQVLLSRYSGQEDVSVGTVVAGRSRAELEGLIGLFANMLVFRQDLSANPTFRELLARVRDFTNAAFAHGECPFGKVVEELQPPRSLSASPLFQVMLVLKNAQQSTLRIRNLEISPLTIHNGRAQFDLTLTLVDTDQGLQGTVEYNTELFDASTIRRMLEHLRVLLGSIVADPGRPIGELPLLAEAERGQLLVDWNNTRTDDPRDRCVHELFEAQVERTPEAVAAVFQDRRLTYRELNARANQLAHHLIGLGIGPETLVGLGVERSLEMIVAILGILKAGGAYVPLDPTWPAERLAFMLEDSRAPVLVTDRRVSILLPRHEARVVNLDAEADWLYAGTATNPSPRACSENLAYVMYTSGSTGKPKGVQILHSGLLNFLNAMQEQPGLSERDVLLAVTTCSFDISVLELLLPLVVGARVVVAPRDVAADGERLSAEIARSTATVMQATPATWRLLLASGWLGSPGLKVLCGGEALARELVDQLRARVGCIWNMYGPTETTIWSTKHRVGPESGPIPIGRPIANTRVYVLDHRQQGVPIGVPGELYIGGDGVARGYLRRPELTAEKFLPDPFSNRPETRMYRTGDLVRWRADGNLEFLGRLDQQVKLRGFRIELEEIEAVLEEHPQVRHAVVLLREDRPNEKRLLAYVVTQQAETPPAAANLRSYLQEKLPDYMVPSVIVVLDALPLTPNGKVDRKALPVPEKVGGQGSCDYVASRTPIEMELVRILSDVLHVEHLGIHDNFFDLGGDSLMAAQTIFRVRNACGVDLPLRYLFEAPTVAQLAAVINSRSSSSSMTSHNTATAVPRLDREQGSTRDDTVPLSRGGQAEGLFIHGDVLDPLQFSEIIRSGVGGVPLVCMGDSRPIIPFVLNGRSPHIPVYQLKIDGGNVWPPRYLTAADQLEIHVRALETLSAERKATVVGFSYSGILAYRFAVALLDRGWSEVGVVLIEPAISIRFLRFWRYRLLTRWLKSMLARTFSRSHSGVSRRRMTLKGPFPSEAPQLPTNPDARTRFDIMEGHFGKIVDSIQPFTFRGPMALVGSESYQARYSQLWQAFTPTKLAHCVFAETDDHFACLSEPYNDQLLDFMEQWCNRSSAP